jgi:hypothetical protein
MTESTFEDVFLRFLDQLQNVAVEIVPVNNGGAVRGGKDRATQLHRRRLGKKQGRGVYQFAVFEQAQLFDGVCGGIPEEAGSFDKAFQLAFLLVKPIPVLYPFIFDVSALSTIGVRSGLFYTPPDRPR